MDSCALCILSSGCVFPGASSDTESRGCGFIHSGASQAVAATKQIGQGNESVLS